MVFLDSFAMSSLRVRQGPSPPTVEQIMEDLSAASDEDVIFKSSVVDVVEQATQTNNASSQASLDERVIRQNLGEKEETESKGISEQTSMEGESNELLYGKVATFLEQFKSLESAQEQLKSLEGDLKSKKEGLEEAISRVKEAWKVDKSAGTCE